MKKIKKISIGLFAGFISGIFASGGGLILLPALVHLLGIEEKEARATVIYCIAVFAFIVFGIYSQNSLINWKIGSLSAFGRLYRKFFRSKINESNFYFMA